MYLGAFVCQKCRDEIVDKHQQEKYLYNKSVSASEIWNDYQLKILDMGGNELLQYYMEEHKIASIDFTNNKI